MSTKPDIIRQLEIIKPRLKTRSGLISSLRSFFRDKGFLEVDTPLVIDAPAPEEYIEAPATGKNFLRTSPELQMKCMLAAGYDKIFQIGACFRKGEFGKLHRPEFTMLEWYETGIDYIQLAEFTRKMLLDACLGVTGKNTLEFCGRKIDFAGEWEFLTVDNAYKKYAGVDIRHIQKGDAFDELMVTKIEPKLGMTTPTFLIDYPAERAALSRLKKSDSSVAERWELYIGGIELANAFSELTDPVEQRKRFKQARSQRQEEGYSDYPPNDDFFDALEYGMPESSGCALGIDRLAMVFSGAEDISEVTFPCHP